MVFSYFPLALSDNNRFYQRKTIRTAYTDLIAKMEVSRGLQDDLYQTFAE